MDLKYHIHYHAEGARGTQLESLTPTNAAGGYASGPFVRRLWDEMKASLYKTGKMQHPDSGQTLDVAILMFGGQPDRAGNGQGGQTCQRWKAGGIVEIVMEPEPAIYGPDAIRARLEAEAHAKALAEAQSVPDQPEPPTMSAADILPSPHADVTQEVSLSIDEDEEAAEDEETITKHVKPTRKRPRKAAQRDDFG